MLLCRFLQLCIIEVTERVINQSANKYPMDEVIKIESEECVMERV